MVGVIWSQGQKLKIKLIAIIALLTLGFHIRFYPYNSRSPLLAGWGANVDWTRWNIIQNHELGVLQSPLTDIASRAGAQSYDIGSIFYASVNVVTGTTGLTEGLRFLGAVPVLGICIAPLIAIVWYRRTSRWEGNRFNHFHEVLLIALALFLSAKFILRTSRGMHTANLTRILLLFIIYSIARMPSNDRSTSKKFAIIYVIFIAALANMYHTWTFYLLMLLLTVFTVAPIAERIRTSRQQWDAIPLYTIGVGIIILLIVSIWMNDRFHEITGTVVNTLFASGGQDYFSASASSYVETSSSDVLSNLNLRRIVTIAAYLISMAVIAIFGLERVLDGRAGVIKALANKYERILLISLLMFIPMSISMLAYGVLPIARMESVGIYWVLFISATILAQQRRSVPAVKICMALIVVSSLLLVGIIGPGNPSQRMTYEEESTVTFAGNYVGQSETIFSDGSIAPSLIYYYHTNLVTIRVTFPNWEQYLEDIYFQHSASEADRAIRDTIRQASFEANPPTDRYYTIFTEGPSNSGVSLYTFQTIPVPNDYQRKYRNSPRYEVVYTTGENAVYLKR